MEFFKSEKLNKPVKPSTMYPQSREIEKLKLDLRIANSDFIGSDSLPEQKRYMAIIEKLEQEIKTLEFKEGRKW